MSNLVVFYVPIRYKYGSRQVTSSSISVSYGYNSANISDFNNKSTGTRAPATQAILNNLPQWMEMRKNTSSRGWSFVNAWGQNFEYVYQDTLDTLSELHLETTRKTQRSKVTSIDISDKGLLVEKTFDNLLYNSSFTIRGPSRDGLPMGWQRYARDDKPRVFSIDARSYICPKTMVIDRIGSIGQSIFMNEVSIKDITSSLYYYTEAAQVDFIMLSIIELFDGTTRINSHKIDTATSTWKRIHSTVSVNSKVYRIHFILHSNSSAPVYINAPKLEIGSMATKWCKANTDYLPYSPSFSNFSQVCAVQG